MDTRSLLALAVAALALGCSSTAHSPASRRDYYAQATCTDTVTCCVQRNPEAPEACSLSASEAASLMAGAKAAGPRGSGDGQRHAGVGRFAQRGTARVEAGVHPLLR